MTRDSDDSFQSPSDQSGTCLTRRSYLKSVSMLPLSSTADRARTKNVHSAPTELLDTSIEPKDPFIVAGAGIPFFRSEAGWEPVPASVRAETILGLHLDKLDCHRGMPNPLPPINERIRGATGQLRFFASEHGRSVSSQDLYMIISDNQFERWYSDLPQSEKWRGPDGSIAERLKDAAVKRLDGSPFTTDFAGTEHVLPSLHSPDVLERKTQAAVGHIATGFTDFYLDNAGSPGWDIDFSEWAQSAFRTHLESLPDDRLDALGIANPEGFNLGGYITNNDLGGGQIQSPGVDPVLAEFVVFHCLTHKQFMEDLAENIREAFPQLASNDLLNVTANHGLLMWANTVYITDAFDTIFLEAEHTVPPKRVHDFVYKIGRAAGRFEKPAIAIGNMIRIGDEVDTTAGLDPSRRYPTLLRLQMAEGYANGGIRSLPLTGWSGISIDNVVDNWVHADGTVSDELQSFIDFVWGNRRFLHEGESAHSVAIIYSLPTLLWKNRGPWYQPNRHRFTFEGAAALCREHHLPYDALIFGHPRLWTDDGQLDRLDRYEVVVLPAVESITDSQVDRLRSLLDKGVTVVTSGPAPDRNAMYVSRSDAVDLLTSHENASILDFNPALSRYEEGESDGSLVKAIEAGSRQVELSTEADIGVNVRVQSERNRTVIHLVNYEYDSDSDSISTVSDIDIEAELDFDPVEARWISPDETRDIEVNQVGNKVAVTVPSLAEWGFIVFGATEGALESEGKQSTASNQIEDAEAAVDQAVAENREDGLAGARVSLREGKIAAEHGAYDQAAAAARRAKSVADAAQPRLTVGIDQSHGQPNSEMGMDQFRETLRLFDVYEFSAVSSWTKETLSDLDLLIVPPVLSEFGLRYDFTSGELSRITNFVGDGGGLLIFGEGGVAKDINDLAGQFGVEFDGRTIAYPEAALPSYQTNGFNVDGVAELSVPPPGRQLWTIRYGTPLSKTGNATVHARVAGDTEALVNHAGPAAERNEGDQPAAHKPVIATAKSGGGIVTAAGMDRLLMEPLKGRFGLSNWEVMLDVFSRIERHLRDASPTTPTAQTVTSTSSGERSTTTLRPQTDDTIVSPANHNDTDTTSTPGFGFGTALGGLAGGMVLIKWLLEENDDS